MASVAMKNVQKVIRDLFSESSHLSHIQFATQGMHDAPGSKEEESFKEGMGHQMEDSSAECTHAHAQEHVTQLADGRIGQNFLDIVLTESNGSCIDGSRHADYGNDRHGDGCHAVEYITPGDHVYPCGHHGGRVDKGTDRRGTFHGIGEPHI